MAVQRREPVEQSPICESLSRSQAVLPRLVSRCGRFKRREGARSPLSTESVKRHCPGTRFDFYLHGELQTIVEIRVTLLGVEVRRWVVQVPAGLIGPHHLKRRFYGEGILMAVHTATVNVS